MPLAVGEVFAGYNIVRVLGAGAMGTVHLARHPRLPRHDALKVSSAELTADPEYRARFLREAEIAATLSHPNILPPNICCLGHRRIRSRCSLGKDAKKRMGPPVNLAISTQNMCGPAGRSSY